MADRSLTRSLPLRPEYNPGATLEARIVALEEWRVEVDAKLAELESRIEALEP